MTLQLRPTFSESWYRVANLKVKLRSSAQITRQYYRGERWYVVRDPAGNQFHRLSDAAYRFVGLLDGKRTIEEAWDLVGGQLADEAPTQPEVIHILSQLYSANLIETDISPDATVLLRRHKSMAKRKLQGRLMNALFPRIPLWDPDQFLKRWMPVVRLFFSKFGMVLWLAVVISAVVMLMPRSKELQQAAVNSVDLQNNPANLFWLWGVFVITKLIHELGHAFACRRFGGECHELGIMFLIFVPTPYVDASSAWAFPSKWARMFVGLAGMIVEIFFAAIAAFVWMNTNEQSLINQLAYNAMLIASVTTVLFNANPLLRYDGYYILSDWLEIPNLRQKSQEYTLGLIKRHIFRVKRQEPLPPVTQRIWLFVYAVTSTIYRVFIGIMIMLLVTYQIPVLGVLMGIGALITFLVVPIFKLFKYLTLDAELHRKRGRAIAFSAAVAIGIVVLIGMINFRVDLDAVGVVEAADQAIVKVAKDGFVDKVHVEDGAKVKKDDVLITMRNIELDNRILQAEAQLEMQKLQYRQSSVEDEAQKKIDALAIATTEKQLVELRRQKDELIIRSPIDGEVIGHHLHQLADRYLTPGEAVLTVASMDRMTIKAVMEQRDVLLVERHWSRPDSQRLTEIRLASDVSTVITGTDPALGPAAQERVAHPSLTNVTGENIAVDPSDKEGTKTREQQFEIRVKLPETTAACIPGQRAYLRLRLDEQPLAEQWMRRFYQLIQSRSAASEWL